MNYVIKSWEAEESEQDTRPSLGESIWTRARGRAFARQLPTSWRSLGKQPCKRIIVECFICFICIKNELLPFTVCHVSAWKWEELSGSWIAFLCDMLVWLDHMDPRTFRGITFNFLVFFFLFSPWLSPQLFPLSSFPSQNYWASNCWMTSFCFKHRY